MSAMSRTLHKTEEAYMEMVEKALDKNPELALMGSCVLVMLMKDQDVYVMNLGDSRVILAQEGTDECQANPYMAKDDSGSRNKFRESVSRLELDRISEESPMHSQTTGGSNINKSKGISACRVNMRAVQLSTDHNTSIEEEVLRIRSEHADDNQAMLNDRVKGQLKVTRAFGAGFLKKPKCNEALLEMFRIDYIGTYPYLSCIPSVRHHRLSSNDRFLVLSSDGLYQYFSNEEVVSHVAWFMENVPDGDPAQNLIAELLSRAAKKNGMDFHELLDIPHGDRRKYHDDVSVMVISLEGRIWRSSGQNNVVIQPMPVTNPFGTLPAMARLSIGRADSAPSVQYGISSMPVADKRTSARVSSLCRLRHLSQRRIRFSIMKYHPKDALKVPFFSEDNEAPSTIKADAPFVPRALVIRPMDQWPQRSSVENQSPLKDVDTTVHPSESPPENGLDRSQNASPAKTTQKSHGTHEDHGHKGDSYITISGHRAGEAAIVYEHGADIEALMPKLRQADYYTEPRIQELAAKERAEPGYCRYVKDFVVGRHGYGSIKFYGETDVRRLDLESLVQFNNREVIVYMDENKKPPIGQGLNKPAEVTLLNIKCINKKTGEQYTEGPKVEKYKEMLMNKTQEQGAKFISYDPVKGEWMFNVEHFSRYELRDDEETCICCSSDCCSCLSSVSDCKR